VLLQGTKRPAPVEGPFFAVQQVSKFTAISFGYGPRAKHHAGVSVAIRRDICSRRDIVEVGFPVDPQVVGRAGSVRVKRGRMDLLAVSAYFPPSFSSGGGAQGLRQAGSVAECQGVQGPGRAFVIVGMDANCHVGLVKEQGALVPDMSSAVGPLWPDLTDQAGQRLKQLLEQQHLAAANTFKANAPTSYPMKRGARPTRPDYIWLPLTSCMDGRVRRMYINQRAGDRLQQAPGFYRADHRPLCAVVDVAVYSAPQPEHHAGILARWPRRWPGAGRTT